MYIHKEGRKIICNSFLLFVLMVALLVLSSPHWVVCHWIVAAILFVLWLFIVSFFRIPKRTAVVDDSALISPADGKLCTVEEVFEREYLNCRCLQVSVFMNGTDVHVNRYPCNGTVEYVNFQRGNYFVASLPKSSDLNERCTIGMRMESGEKILIRQIAGLMARRIVCYAKEGDQVKQNEELGFIKFGSRVDLFLPLGSSVIPNMQEQVSGCLSRLAQTPMNLRKQ